MLDQIALHIRHDETQVFHLVARPDVEHGEMIRRSVALAGVADIVLRRVGDGVDRPDQRLFHMLRQKIRDDERDDACRDHILDHERAHPGSDFLERDVREDEAGRRVLSAVNRHARRAQPGIVLTVSDIIQLSFSIPVEEKLDLFLIDRLPIAGLTDMAGSLVRIGYIDDRAGLFVIDREINIVHIAGSEKLLQDRAEDPIVLPLGNVRKMGAEFVRPRFGALFLAERVIDLHHVARKALGVDHLLHDRGRRA